MPQLVAIGRTYLARAATNLSPSRRAALEGFGLRRAVASGPLVVAEGPAKGLRLDGRHFPIAHVQASWTGDSKSPRTSPNALAQRRPLRAAARMQ